MRWTEEEAKIPVRKAEIIGMCNGLIIVTEKNVRDVKRRQEPAKRNF